MSSDVKHSPRAALDVLIEVKIGPERARGAPFPDFALHSVWLKFPSRPIEIKTNIYQLMSESVVIICHLRW